MLVISGFSVFEGHLRLHWVFFSFHFSFIFFLSSTKRAEHHGSIPIISVTIWASSMCQIYAEEKPKLCSHLQGPTLDPATLSPRLRVRYSAPGSLTSLLFWNRQAHSHLRHLQFTFLLLEHSCSRCPCVPSAPTTHGSNCVLSVRTFPTNLLNWAPTLLLAPLFTLFLSVSVATRM